MKVIEKSAFTTSPYPVILSIENHCSIQQQKKMAVIFKVGRGGKEGRKDIDRDRDRTTRTKKGQKNRKRKRDGDLNIETNLQKYRNQKTIGCKESNATLL